MENELLRYERLAEDLIWNRGADPIQAFAEYFRKGRVKKSESLVKLPLEERFEARLKLAALPRNSAPSRVRNRCEVTGRPRAYYRKFRLCRIQLRDLANKGLIPGVTKSSW